MIQRGCSRCYRQSSGRCAQVLQGSKALPDDPALLCERPPFLRHDMCAEVVPLCIIRPANPCRCLKVPEIPPRIGALFHAPMILLHSIIEVALGALHHVAAPSPANSPRIGGVAIGRHALWEATRYFLGLLEERLGCSHGSVLTEPGIHQVAVPIAEGAIAKSSFLCRFVSLGGRTGWAMQQMAPLGLLLREQSHFPPC